MMGTERTGTRPLIFFFASVACLGVAGAVFETTLNNYLSDQFGLTAEERGKLEFPRELPGFLTALFAGALLFLPEARMGAIAAMSVALGLFGLSQVDIAYSHMLVWLVLWSCGAHLMMPIETSLAIELSKEGRAGTRLGQVGSVRTFGMLVGSGLVWLVFGEFESQYRIAFIAAGSIALVASLVLLRMPTNRHHSHEPTRFLFRKRYSLFYLLCALFGARKQVFITFGPWVLIKVFEQPAQVIGKLWFVAGVLGLVFKPLLGRMIDWLGERTILFVDGLVLMAICLGYGFAESLLPRETAIYLLYGCFIFDNLMFAVGMARHTYVSKIADDPRDITPTFSLGITINHVVSMSVPWLGGLLWMSFGYSKVFIAAAGVALVTAVAALFIKVPPPKNDQGEANVELK